MSQNKNETQVVDLIKEVPMQLLEEPKYKLNFSQDLKEFNPLFLRLNDTGKYFIEGEDKIEKERSPSIQNEKSINILIDKQFSKNKNIMNADPLFVKNDSSHKGILGRIKRPKLEQLLPSELMTEASASDLSDKSVTYLGCNPELNFNSRETNLKNKKRKQEAEASSDSKKQRTTKSTDQNRIKMVPLKQSQKLLNKLICNLGTYILKRKSMQKLLESFQSNLSQSNFEIDLTRFEEENKLLSQMKYFLEQEFLRISKYEQQQREEYNHNIEDPFNILVVNFQKLQVSQREKQPQQHCSENLFMGLTKIPRPDNTECGKEKASCLKNSLDVLEGYESQNHSGQIQNRLENSRIHKLITAPSALLSG